MEKDFRVRARREDRALLFQLGADLVGVHEVAVVRDGERALVRVVDDGLSVLEERLARRRIPHVADRRGAGQAGEPCFVEDVRDVSHLLLDGHALARPRDDSGGLLPPVLHRIEPEVRQVRGVRVTVDAEDPALVAELVLRLFLGSPRHVSSLSHRDGPEVAREAHGIGNFAWASPGFTSSSSKRVSSVDFRVALLELQDEGLEVLAIPLVGRLLDREARLLQRLLRVSVAA